MADNTIAAQATTNQPAQTGNQTPANNTPGAKPGETPAQTQARLLKVKIDGQEREIPESDVIRDYQLAETSRTRLNEASKMREQATEALKLMKSDTKEALRRLGIDPYKFAEEVAAEQIANEMLSPQEKETRDLKAKLTEYQRKEEETQAKAKEQEANALVGKYVDDISKKTIDAAKAARLPIQGTAGSRTMMRYAQYMAQMYDSGYTDINPSDVTDLVVADYKTDIKELLGSVDDELVAQFLGEDVMKRVSKAQLARVQGAQASKKQPSGPQKNVQKPSSKKEKKYKDPGDFFDNIRKQYGNG